VPRAPQRTWSWAGGAGAAPDAGPGGVGGGGGATGRVGFEERRGVALGSRAGGWGWGEALVPVVAAGAWLAARRGRGRGSDRGPPGGAGPPRRLPWAFLGPAPAGPTLPTVGGGAARPARRGAGR